MLSNLNQYNIILCSNSPRRKELLKGLGLTFQTKVISGIDETYPDNLQGDDIALYISQKKAQAYKEIITNNDLIITADTIVYLSYNDKNGKTTKTVLGKPYNEDDAKNMLRKLSGHAHQVITGVTIATLNHTKSFAVSTKVYFAELTDEEINYYVSEYKPFDKAGAYGIQEWIGYIGVNRLEGSYFNVMGLPVQRLYEELKHFNTENLVNKN